ncbi:DUF5372 family protein [Sphingobium sp.]|uniref:DUF5372 family protein n=1 Tax=Sphingobium sp. TaxID=1912891 RepID=UPI00338DC03D
MPPSAPSRRPGWRAIGSGPAQAACNSGRSAGDSLISRQLVIITHPFHPYSGQRAVCVGERVNRAGKRLLLRFEDGRISPVPLQWTDVVVPDFAVVAGSGLALCGFADLLELARLVEGLVARERAAKPKSRKDNYAAHVKQITPRSPWSLR